MSKINGSISGHVASQSSHRAHRISFAMDRRAAKAAEDERSLLLELAQGKKTFEQVSIDAKRLCRNGVDLRALTGSNPARSITNRLVELTGISKDNLHVFPVRCKPAAAEQGLGGDKMRLPFILLSTHVEQLLGKDGSYFEIELGVRKEEVAASSFISSREYINHDLVQACFPLGETVVPAGLYSDGVSVGMDPHADSLYVVYIYFLHRPLREAGRPESKFVFTLYRKSEATPETLEDIWKVLLWELQALQHGRRPMVGQESLPLHEQVPGEHLCGRWGRWHRICLMQVKGDWSWYTEALGIPQWNCNGHMCPFCGAHGKGHLRWRDFSLEAPWRATCRTHDKFLADMRHSKSQNFRHGSCAFKCEPLLALAPHFRWTMVKLDWMHAADLGVLVYVIGEVWWSILPALAGGNGRSAAQKRELGLRELKGRLKAYYSEHRISNKLPLKRLTLNKIKSKGHPKLKAKAAQAKDLLRFTTLLADEFKSDAAPIAESRYQMMQELSAMYVLAALREVSSQQLMDWRMHASLFFFWYVSCGFRVYPKFHYLLHAAGQVEQSGVVRSFWVYAEESKNRQPKHLFNVCSKGAALYQQMLLRLQWSHALSD